MGILNLMILKCQEIANFNFFKTKSSKTKSQRAGGGFWILNLMILIRYAPKKRIFPKYYERLSLRVECSCSQLGRPKAWRLYICNSQYHNIIMILSQYHNNNAQYHNFTNDNITTKSQLHNDSITIVMHNNINIS